MQMVDYRPHIVYSIVIIVVLFKNYFKWGVLVER